MIESEIRFDQIVLSDLHNISKLRNANLSLVNSKDKSKWNDKLFGLNQFVLLNSEKISFLIEEESQKQFWKRDSSLDFWLNCSILLEWMISFSVKDFFHSSLEKFSLIISTFSLSHIDLAKSSRGIYQVINLNIWNF